MKFDTSGISLPALAAHLGEMYGVPIATIAFIPKGEDAYTYLATGPRGERFFVRVQHGHGHGHGAQTGDLETIYAAVSTLQTDRGISAALAPYRTREGRFTIRFGAYTVALFPFIEGSTAYDTSMSDAQWMAVAEIIAALHASGERCLRPPLARETFANPFATPIARALRRAASNTLPASTYQARTIALLREQEADLQATLQRMDQMRRAALRLAPLLAPSHGDPNLANVLIDGACALHLTDWGELALAPAERDLFAFTGERFDPFLRHYVSQTGHIRLHRLLFAFYLSRWAMHEIADYTSRLLFGTGDPDEEAHAWQELQPYLPIPHAAIEADLAAIMAVLHPLAARGLLQVDETL